MEYNITDIRYDMGGNPAFVAFGVGHETEYGYTTDGVKLWTVHRTVTGTLSSTFLSNKSNPKPTPEIGNTPSRYSRLTDRVIKSLDVTRYYDAFEFEDAALTEGKFYFGGGYVSFHTDGSTDYSALVRDYRGSTRLVMAFDGSCSHPTLVQINGYYPSGALVSDLQTAIQLDESAADIQTRKFTGKELDRMHGLDWHDLGARCYDAAVVTFTQIDPLCEKYYHISPYVYCAGNPIRYVDPDGREIRYSMTEEQKEAFKSQIQFYRDNSEVFNTMYSSLEQSENVYVVKFGETPKDDRGRNVDGVFHPDKSADGGTVVFYDILYAKGKEIPMNVLSEEFFHAYQNDNITDYSKGEFNMEFEAKCFITLVGTECVGYSDFGNDMSVCDFLNQLSRNMDSFVTPESVVSSPFLERYNAAANSFAVDYKQRKEGNKHYWVPTSPTVAPASLQKVIINTY